MVVLRHPRNRGLFSSLSIGSIESEDSVSSTLLVKTHDEKPSTRPVRVQFNLAANRVAPAVPLDPDEDSSVRWYSASDYKKFRAVTRRVADVIFQFEQQQAADDAQSYGNIVLRAYDECCTAQRPSVLQKHAERLRRYWNRDGGAHLRSGLEQEILAPLARQQQRRRKDLQIAVAFRMVFGCGEGPGESFEDALRKTCEERSLPSRLFAQLMAQAQQSS